MVPFSAATARFAKQDCPVFRKLSLINQPLAFVSLPAVPSHFNAAVPWQLMKLMRNDASHPGICEVLVWRGIATILVMLILWEGSLLEEVIGL